MLDIEKRRKLNSRSDYELLPNYKNKYNLRGDYKVIYTNGSKQNDKRSVGIGIAIDDSDIA